jgi:hypothetical protein
VNDQPKNWLRNKDNPEGPSMTRIAVWLVVGGIGAYFLISGIIGILGGGQ